MRQVQEKLVCDHCQTKPRKDAVRTLSLQNGPGTRGEPISSLDLCEAHLNEVIRFFRIRKAEGTPSIEEKEMYAAKEREMIRAVVKKKKSDYSAVGRKLNLSPESLERRKASMRKIQEANRPKIEKMWAERMEKIITVLERSRGRWVQTPDIAPAVRMNNYVTRHTLNRLLAARKAVRKGVGPHAAYQLL